MGRVKKKHLLSSRPLPLSHADERLFSLIDAQQQKAAFIESAVQGVIDLSLRMAEKLVGNAVEKHPDILQRRYEEALALTESLAPGTITIHSKGHQVPINELAAAAGFQVIINDMLHPADCIVEAGGVRVESTVKTAMVLFRHALEGTSHQ